MTIRLMLRITAKLLLGVWCVITVLPTLSAVLLSFHSTISIYRYPLGFAGTWQVQNFGVAWRGPAGGVGIPTLLVNSATAAALGIALSLTTGSAAAYVIRYLRPRWRAWILRLCVGGMVVPVILLMIPIYYAVNGLGVLNEPAIVGVVYGGLALPGTVLILQAFYADFPTELVDAAMVEGASHRATFVRVILPMSRGPLLTVAVLVLISIWGEAQLGYILLQNPRSETLAVGLLGFQGEYLTDYGALFAGLTLAMVPVLAAYLVFSKHILRGVALSSGVKG